MICCSSRKEVQFGQLPNPNGAGEVGDGLSDGLFYGCRKFRDLEALPE